MSGPMGIVAVVIVVLVIAVIALSLYAVRLMRLLRRYGTFQCALRRPAGKWEVGVMLLSASSIEWFPRRSMAMQPKLVFPRADVEIKKHVPSSLADCLVVSVAVAGVAYEIVMRTTEFSGLVSWVDSASPSEEPSVF